MTSSDPRVAFLRHALATLVYRARKTVAGAPPGFRDFTVHEGSRSPGAILAHMGDLMDWALHLTAGRHVWNDSAPLAWDQEVARFFDAARRLDDALAAASPASAPEALFQGPVADALTHTGQIAMLRRMAGSPVRGENYFKATIQAGGLDGGTSPRVEFD